jgi:CarD family transcriptional regulator, regulator of rRNA transcription
LGPAERRLAPSPPQPDEGDSIAENEDKTAPERVIAPLRVAVGDTVVYASHGVGRIVAREQQRVGGTVRDCVVVELATGLRVTLPLADAAERLRRPADESELDDVQKTLASIPPEREASWTRRINESKAKLATGKATDLAQIVRDGVRFERGSNGVRLSHSERRVYVQARALLVGELCSARGMHEDEAEVWIDSQIAPPDSSRD